MSEDEACPRCGSTSQRDGAEYDYEPDGMCWTECICNNCGLIGGIPFVGWSVDSGPSAEPYDPNDPEQSAYEAAGSSAEGTGQ